MSPSDARVLLVGAGGLGSPAALALAESGVRRMTVIDDDAVDRSNLHRQLLYEDADVGADKAERAAARLRRAGVEAEAVRGRVLPDTARALFAAHDLVLEGADNFATKFLSCDAAHLVGVPLVQAGAVRWSGWALATRPGESACMRCVFEDIPRDGVETCAEAGVIGPVVGVLGALEAALAVRLLEGDATAAGELWSYRGLEGALRAVPVTRRPGCPACAGEIRELTMERYAPAAADCLT
ncbi:MAG TPA: HesA/MoeB/ThiF family protein [Sandaracinaceae bacterium LLY-WYZ-13_1]|nr:HesA/MoeB/ThiF family protein [Sandaracinaceae bacterium LLY-WYZ-13_1]